MRTSQVIFYIAVAILLLAMLAVVLGHRVHAAAPPQAQSFGDIEGAILLSQTPLTTRGDFLTRQFHAGTGASCARRN